ncbi:MAG: hypothetical protein WBQ55_24520 [Xanthobacteraceae bacterium]
MVEVVQEADAATAQSMDKVRLTSDAISASVHQQDMATRKLAQSVDSAADLTARASAGIAEVSELVGYASVGVPLPFLSFVISLRSFLPSSLPGLTRQSMRK